MRRFTGINRNRTGRGRGFTLIECALTIIIVGVGFVSTMQLFTACTTQNASCTNMTTSIMLANQVQEALAGLTFNDPVFSTNFGAESGESLTNFNDLDDFNGQTFNPPINALRWQIQGMDQFTQVVSVVPVYPNKLSANTNPANPEIPQTTYTGAVRITVQILYRANPEDAAQETLRLSWIRVDNVAPTSY